MLNIISIFRDKKNYFIYIPLIIICFLILLTIFMIYNYYVYSISSLKNEPVNRLIEVYTDDSNNFLKYGSIEDYYPVFVKQVIQINSTNYFSNSYTIDIPVSIGENPKKDNEIIISKKLYNDLNLNSANFQRDIECIINCSHYVLKIVGMTNDNNIDVYLNSNMFQEIYGEFPSKFYVLVDNFDNVKNISGMLAKEGIISTVMDDSIQSQIDSLMNMKTIFTYIMYLIFICIVLLFMIIIKNMIRNDEKNIAVLKTLGYHTFKIIYIVFIRLFLILLLSYLLTQLSFIVLSFIFKRLFIMFEIELFDLMKINTLCMLIFVVIMVINILFYKFKILKMCINDTLQSY